MQVVGVANELGGCEVVDEGGDFEPFIRSWFDSSIRPV